MCNIIHSVTLSERYMPSYQRDIVLHVDIHLSLFDVVRAYTNNLIQFTRN